MVVSYPISLEVKEPNNDIGILRIRQSDEESQTLVVQVLEYGLKKSYENLQVFFCARIGQTAGLGIIEQKLTEAEMIDPKNGKLEYTFRAEDWQILGHQTGYFSFRKMKDDHTYEQQFSTRDFTYEVTKSIYSDGIKEVKKDGSTYVWTIEDLIRLLNEYIDSGKSDWEEFVEQNKDILASVDPGGQILSELINARTSVTAGGFPTLNERLDYADTNLATLANEFESKKRFKPKLSRNVYFADAETGAAETDKKIAQIDILAQSGVNGLVLPLQITFKNNVWTLINNIEDDIDVLQYAKDKGIELVAIKFHLPGFDRSTITDIEKFKAGYRSIILDTCTKMKSLGIPYCTILNEKKALANDTTLSSYWVDLMTSVKLLGYKTGITNAGFTGLYSMPQALITASDLICCNVYPPISNKKNATTYSDSISSWGAHGIVQFFGEFKSKYPDKKIILSETGMLDYWDALIAPSQYNFTGDLTGGLALSIYYKGMFETMSNCVDEIWFWFNVPPIDLLNEYVIKKGDTNG